MARSKLDLLADFKDPSSILAVGKKIQERAKNLNGELNIMEVCGGHTHAIMRYSLLGLLPSNISFIHGPGCPVCIMPKERIDHAYTLAMQKDVILATLGDMIRVPGSLGSLDMARSKGADVRALYTPLDLIKIAQENPKKTVVFFAIGFETTTPMTAVLIEKTLKLNIKNLFFHINHVLVPPAVYSVMDSKETKINAILAPSHVSVITGFKIYEPICAKYKMPVVVGGFEPLDVMTAVLMMLEQKLQGVFETQNEYSRSVSKNGNVTAQKLINTYMQERPSFRWRGLGDIPRSALELRQEYKHLCAEQKFADILPNTPINDHKQCICAQILRGIKKPFDCKIFAKGCNPQNPIGSCMVSDEGACNAYFKYARK